MKSGSFAVPGPESPKVKIDSLQSQDYTGSDKVRSFLERELYRLRHRVKGR